MSTTVLEPASPPTGQATRSPLLTPYQTPSPYLTPVTPGRRLAQPGSLLVLALFGLFIFVLVRCAWVAEDAYIMFRTIDNVLHGHGLTWNLGERVQVYTCPLWMFTLLGAIAWTREYFLTTIAVSAAISLATVGLVAWRLAATRAAAALGVAVLVLSKGFIDYATSGLENPLTHLLLVAFVLVYRGVATRPDTRGLFWLTLLAALGMTNRLDTSLCFLPALAWIFWQVPKVRGMAVGLLGLAPLVAWECFSLIYYGLLFPNTAYAKLNLGMSAAEFTYQGLCYYANAWRTDPMTLLVIATGLLAPWLVRRWQDLPLALGAALYLLYIIKIGGDYMSMRFFTAPLILAVAILVQTPALQRPLLSLTAVLLLAAVSWCSPRCPLRSDASFGTGTFELEPVLGLAAFGSSDFTGEVDRWGIADERGFYNPRGLGLLTAFSEELPKGCVSPAEIERQREQNRKARRRVLTSGNVGVFVFQRGENVHVIDTRALADPLTARLPRVARTCRVGHYDRVLPEGYVRSVLRKRNLFADPNVGLYYEKLHQIVSGPIFSRGRWQAIWEMHTGQLDHLVDREHYRFTRRPPAKALSSLTDASSSDP